MWQPYSPHCVSKLSHWLQTVRKSNKPETHTFIWRFGSINRGDAASTNQTHSTQRDLQHRDTAMAPTITSAMNISNEQLPLNNKLRKPMVEKMRRDRINSSIEQLKSLLAPEFLNQQPDSKPDKGDILEMTVSFLRQQQQQPAFSSTSAAVNQGFSRCVHDIVHFLSKDEVKTQSERKLLNHFQNLQPSSDENRRESVLAQLSSTEQQIISKEKTSVKSSLWRPVQFTSVVAENKTMKENILDLQSRSMRDNLVFTGIPEQTPDDPEKSVKDFMIKQLKLPAETVQSITFHRVHRIRSKNNNNRPRAIIAKFEHYKHKELVQRQGKQLKGTNYGLNDQYPKVILERRKQLVPIRKQKINEGKKAVITVDKLYIDGQLYRDKDITPWLF